MALTNWEIVVYALHLLDGATKSVHTEDIAVKAFNLAPDIYSWVKYPNYPDKEIVRKQLVHARNDYGDLVKGRSGTGKGQSDDPMLDGWMLTEAGVRWIMENEDRLALELNQRQPKVRRQELLQKLSRIRNHHLFKEFKDQPEGFVPTLGSLAELLRCRVDTEKAIWEKRFLTLRNQAQLANQNDLLAFLDICQRFVNSSLETHQ